MRARHVIATVALFLMASGAQAPGASEVAEIPAALQPWKDWVLHGEEQRLCPTFYNDGKLHRCTWPSRLYLDLDRSGGRFNQTWLVFAEGWVPLPGDRDTWPREVTAGGREIPVIERNEVPCAYLPAGEHMVTGRFLWEELPEMIHVPPAVGLLGLTLDGSPVPFPRREGDGRLWLKGDRRIQDREDRLDIRIYRLITDSIPLEVTTLLRLNVSGQAREVTLKGALIEGFIPMAVQSPIPARLDREGDLMIQARPGRWEVEVRARSEGPVHRIGPLAAPQGQEIWAFEPRNHLRMVQVEGVPSVDPTQTDSPEPWRGYAHFLIDRQSRIDLKEIRRGDPEPAPDRLTLERTWWLDFNGKGYTLRDRVAGTMSRQWYLAMNPPVVLGRVTVEGEDRLITAHGVDRKPGVELRRGHLDLTAESRLPSASKALPAVGWDHAFQSVSGVLNLPPGWRLFTVQGVDVMPGTWFEQWTLLDLFIVLIIALAVARLWNWPWGLLALVTLGLIYHEPGSPRIVWLNLLAASALLRFIPRGWFNKAVNLWRILALVTLLVLAIPFMVQQARWGVYPQLEPRYVTSRPGLGVAKREAEALKSSEALLDRTTGAPPPQQEMKRQPDYYSNQAIQAFDANALNQTGPGLPTWAWRSYEMRWTGPVEADQQVRFHLIPPTVNLALAFARVLLLALLILRLLDIRQWRLRDDTFAFAPLLLCAFFLWPKPAGAEEGAVHYPPGELLKELRTRLLEPPDCLPRCAESPRMEITASPQALRILFQVHAARETGVPLPGSAEFWLPDQVFVDAEPARGLSRDAEGTLWVLVPEGVHGVSLTGPLPRVKELQIPLPLPPRRVTWEGVGWEIQGVGRNGHVKTSIKLIREQQEEEQGGEEGTQMNLPAFFRVERILSLGLEWQVRSRVSRLTPLGTPAVVSLPLLPGESVTTAGLRVADGRIRIQMDPRVGEIRWDSTLPRTREIHLEAPSHVPWTETWTLESSPIWHCEPSGIPIIHHQDQAGYWRPRWEPWPGERVSIRVSRPEAIPGKVLTVDSVDLEYGPGQRLNRATLALNIRTSKGGQHRILLPEGARLQGLAIMGAEQPIRQAGREVIVPLQPGAQGIEVRWHQDVGSGFPLRAPEVEIGEQAVNADVVIQMPRNRWILWASGPRLGPAVLFWSYMAVVLLAALALGRIPWTPLTTRHWLLLGLGLTQVHPLAAVMIVGWLLALGIRKKAPRPESRYLFDLSQLILVLWTIAALIGLYVAIQKGLLGIPQMQISGNGSTDFWLHWTQDRIEGTMPRPAVFSLHLTVFRFLMLAWALWLAFSLLKWLRWGWTCFNEGGAWRKVLRGRRGGAGAEGPQESRP